MTISKSNLRILQKLVNRSLREMHNERKYEYLSQGSSTFSLAGRIQDLEGELARRTVRSLGGGELARRTVRFLGGVGGHLTHCKVDFFLSQAG